MTRTTILLNLSLLLTACEQLPRERFRVPTRPTATPEPIPAPSPAPIVRTIQVGEEVKEVFTGLGQAYEFTAPKSGRLVARLTWDVWFNGSILTLEMGGEYAAPPQRWSPLVGTWDVVAAKAYRLTIGPGGTDWSYNDPFVLTTSIE